MNSKKQKETYPKAYHNQNAHSQSLLEAIIKDMLHTDFSLETIQVRQWSKIFKIMKEERKKKNKPCQFTASHPAKYLSKMKKNNVIFQLKKAERFITRRPKLYEMFKELQWKKNDRWKSRFIHKAMKITGNNSYESKYIRFFLII